MELSHKEIAAIETAIDALNIPQERARIYAALSTCDPDQASLTRDLMETLLPDERRVGQATWQMQNSSYVASDYKIFLSGVPLALLMVEPSGSETGWEVEISLDNQVGDAADLAKSVIDREFQKLMQFAQLLAALPRPGIRDILVQVKA